MARVPKLATELTPYEKFLRLPKIVKVKINGNEIYEGDILRLGNSPSGVCEVKWNTTMAAFCIHVLTAERIIKELENKGIEI